MSKLIKRTSGILKFRISAKELAEADPNAELTFTVLKDSDGDLYPKVKMGNQVQEYDIVSVSTAGESKDVPEGSFLNGIVAFWSDSVGRLKNMISKAVAKKLQNGDYSDGNSDDDGEEVIPFE